MKIPVLISVVSYAGFFAHVAYGKLSVEARLEPPAACVMTGISNLSQINGELSGSSKIEWKECADGNDYLAACHHRGSGENMESCACFVNSNQAYDKNCQGMELTSDLVEASRRCCGYFER